MPRPPALDFFISNNRHHLEMCRPVLAALGDGCSRRVLSLCELRGLVSPTADQLPDAVDLRRVVPMRIRRSPSIGRAQQPGRPASTRRALRRLTWLLLLSPRLRALLRRRPDLAVLPNDAAFPYDHIARLLHRLGVPFLLLQEGIRFPLPGLQEEPTYGSGGAVAIAAWGKGSADYFRQAGASEQSLHLTGSPRFDRLRALADGAQRKKMQARLGLSGRTLLLVSNPIDDQGFCSHKEKMQLVSRFLAQTRPLLEEDRLHIAIKLHGREDAADFRALIGPAERQRVAIFTAETPLWDLLCAVDAVVVLASTVGLEALLCGLPLAVLEIPGHGFQYDYVQSGTALGLSWDAPMAPQLASILRPSEDLQGRVEEYLRHQFEVRSRAAERVADLIHQLLARRR